MLRKLMPLALAFSLAFNIAFVGVWGYERTREHHVPPARWPFFELDLKPEQRQKLRESWRQTAEWVHGLRAEAERHRSALLDLMSADKPDQEAVAKEQGELAAVEEQMRLLVLDQMFEMREVLTPEQRARWLTVMRERGEEGMWGGPYWGSRLMQMRRDHDRRPESGTPGPDGTKQ